MMALQVLSCDEIKLSMTLGQMKGDGDDDALMGGEQQPPPAVQAAAKKAISGAFRQAVMDQVLPHVVALKAFLQKQRSPLLRHGIVLIRELAKDFKDDLAAFLAADHRLQAEIQYDLQKLEVSATDRALTIGYE